LQSNVLAPANPGAKLVAPLHSFEAAALAAFRHYLELAPEAPDASYVRAILDEKP